MSGKRLLRLLGLVDEALIAEAAGPAPRRRRNPRVRLAALAAGAGAAACLILFWRLGSFAPAPENSTGGGAGHDGGTSFMSCAGPVFPLETLEDTALTAERTLTWDFAPGAYPDGSPRQWGAAVTDRYVLSNPGSEDVTVTALYPFAGNFDSLARVRPTVSVDGAEIEAELLAGPYAGGFSSAYGEEDPDHDTLNLAGLNSWEEYQALLEDGTYRDQALGAYPALDIPVTVYRFSNFEAPHEQYQAATQAVSFTIDPENTEILTYGFNGMRWDEETGFRQYSYFVPDGMRREPETKILVVLGEDLGDYTLQGYKDGGCDAGDEITGVSCTVTREETTLDAVLEDLCREYEFFYTQGRAVDQENAFDAVPFAMYRGAVSQLLTQYGILSGQPKDRYADGWLDDILSETLFHRRVLYLEFPITVPAGGSVTVEAALWKEPSYDFYCGQAEGEQVQGYDLVTHLGSALTFTGQQAAVVNTEGIEIVREDFGFDLEQGITQVPLNLEQAHYMLEIREKTP